ncbi:MAG TPA: protocatechuate 3,4-dioxygenase subunit alpha [Acidimicrobiia bacterium]|nr:protocatechuate 3,4-dioxygenase subunit alpha [Acidimicrobiia bacterium]
MRGPTPSQTVGPYFGLKLRGNNVIAGPEATGERIRIEGQVLDGDGSFVEDALIEIWQADGEGRYAQLDDRPSGFTGFGRVETDPATGEYWFETIKPGRVPDPEGELQAPHLVMVVQGRGMLRPVFTRLYFADEREANEVDLILGMVPPERRATLFAAPVRSGDQKVYRFDVRLQGAGETVFFDF